jgi:hypothetical protein
VLVREGLSGKESAGLGLPGQTTHDGVICTIVVSTRAEVPLRELDAHTGRSERWLPNGTRRYPGRVAVLLSIVHGGAEAWRGVVEVDEFVVAGQERDGFTFVVWPLRH